MKYVLIILAIAIFASNASFAQDKPKDKAAFEVHKSEFWDTIKKSNDDFIKKQEKPEKKSFKVDLSGYKFPKKIDEFERCWYNAPVSQGNTGTCWCYSGTSFLESEIYRITKQEIKISEMFTVYWEYVEKARRFVRERGNSVFSEGSQQGGVLRQWKEYGCVPYSDYTGLKSGQTFNDHTKMVGEMTNYLQTVKTQNSWNEETILATIKSILNFYLGVPPSEITFNSKKMTPKEFCTNVAKINTDDYVDIYSMMEKPYWEKCEYEVPDNWWKSANYYNVPLDDFMDALKSAIKANYTITIGGDVSEAGYDSHAKVGMIPTFDIPSEYIDENARQFRFSNQTTTDDHGIHIVGYKVIDGKYWFLIKDSGSGSKNVEPKGYYFYHEDYVKLKMTTYLVHKDAVSSLIKKFK
ncbi:MAG: peptidase C1 [Candidatus Kapabacteria bacterium]|nr:peptidase C1 [Candidatus Kapabacteria bacterium]